MIKARVLLQRISQQESNISSKIQQKYVYHFTAMTTPCEVMLYAKDKATANTVAENILKEVKRLEKKYNYYDPTSLLSQINERPTIELDAETKNLLTRAKQYANLTAGIFDITLATIKNIYTDQTDIKSLEKEKERLLPFVGCEHFSIKKNKIYFDNAFTKLDLGGFVKEYAVDQSVKVLKKYKISSAIVNYGGDLYVLGKKPNGQKFRVGIKDPNNTKEHFEFVDLENQALTTSASYERSYDIEGEAFSHILSKEEDASRPISVTVISHNCVESGVFSTALMVDSALKHAHEAILIHRS